jgi:hypothetical protein
MLDRAKRGIICLHDTFVFPPARALHHGKTFTVYIKAEQAVLRFGTVIELVSAKQ